MMGKQLPAAPLRSIRPPMTPRTSIIAQVATDEPELPESPTCEVRMDGSLAWNNVPIACATCGTSKSLRLQVRYRRARVDPTAHVVCPDGHETSDHPLVYPDMVQAFFTWAATEEPRPPLGTALAGWGPHRTTRIAAEPDDPEDQHTVFYARWSHTSDLEKNRAQWPDLVATVERLWAEAAVAEPPMRPWFAAWLYAEMLTDQFSRSTTHRTDEVRAVIARAITIQAGLDGLLAGAENRLDEARALAPVSLKYVAVERLHQLKVAIEFPQAELGAMPTLGESGYAAYRRVYQLMAYGAEVLDDPVLDAQCQRDTKLFSSHARAAFEVITGAVINTAFPYDDDITLGRLNRQLSQHLARRA